MHDEVPLEEFLNILSVILMAEHGNKVVVTREQIHQARQAMREHEITVVTYDQSRLFDEVAIEFRHKSRNVLAGEVV